MQVKGSEGERSERKRACLWIALPKSALMEQIGMEPLTILKCGCMRFVVVGLGGECRAEPVRWEQEALSLAVPLQQAEAPGIVVHGEGRLFDQHIFLIGSGHPGCIPYWHQTYTEECGSPNSVADQNQVVGLHRSDHRRGGEERLVTE
ncbi:hypothetical protein EYF80_018270 [Liparis tanakae]|uniref:Uncharacterized protein n=1 Tax=Liparis tanakae TaxID=230148 RepID=A0A4Z2I2P1_9TELE|nr:hypothetical protein EYF80_018270 [Liparis tanakae]